ncbi:MAG: hypothetical protein GF388_07420 [Candidatus Aegiribacteria sp.]|nr:hypothetical protein [Candidatus Aegiribacteria sp.]MBD3294956.1 hypothetical protein [Candidatus Fermentibacteria bacterium]
MKPVIYLLSDFGTADTYVAQMKAVLLSISPNAVLVDLTHEVRPGNILQGAFHLWACREVITKGSVVLAVVDPGVGTARNGVAALSGGNYYVGPDNGLFGLLPSAQFRLLQNPPADSSSTFHGRDLFAPSAARLAADPGWFRFLQPLSAEKAVPMNIQPPHAGEGSIDVTVVHVDGFGNVVLWLPPEKAEGFSPSSVILPGGKEVELSHVSTYGSNSGVLYLKGSQGCMELAVSGGGAGAVLDLKPGDRLTLSGETV